MLAPAAAGAQITGPMVPPSIPSSPQPAFPALPSPPAPSSPAAPGPPPPARAPGPAPAPAVAARTQRVSVVAVERHGDRVVLRARDESGADLAFDVASYTAVLATDARRVAVADLGPEDAVEVTWFPEGDRRTLLTVRKVR